MSNKNTLFALGIILLLTINVSAAKITASLGNARAVVNADVGESVERFVKVINSNDVALTINLTADGDLEDNVEFEEESFELEAGEEKDAYFTIEADEAGTFETKINVKFTPPEGQGSPIIMPATVILIASGEGSGDNSDSGADDADSDNPDDADTGTDTDDGDGVSVNPFGRNSVEGNGFKLSPFTILLISSIVLLIVLILLVFYAGRKKTTGQGLYKSKVNTKRGSGRTRE